MRKKRVSLSLFLYVAQQWLAQKFVNLHISIVVKHEARTSKKKRAEGEKVVRH